MKIIVSLGRRIGKTLSFKHFTEECKDNEKLDKAINHYAELSKERYLCNPHNKDLYEWLKELRDRRKGRMG